MKLSLPFGTAELTHPHSLAIPVAFEGERLSAFGAPPPERHAYAAGSFIGDVKQGGSCNCEVYTLNPHCSGTHTECIGHILPEPIFVHEVLKDSLMHATLVSVSPQEAESYHASQPGDLRITRQSLEAAELTDALIIRILPNDTTKRSRNYNTAAMPPYFSDEAIAFIAESSVKHLLVDIPSIDRLDDGGKLTNHRTFWHNAPHRTVTELIYAPPEIPDGTYLLNLQIAPFMADVAPSRPILYEITPL